MPWGVFGTGAVGLAAVMAAAASGAAQVVAVDVNESRLETARELGATHTVNSASGDVAAALAEIVPAGLSCWLASTRTCMISGFTTCMKGVPGST